MLKFKDRAPGLKFSKAEKVWYMKDTLAGRYRAQSMEGCISDITLPDKYRSHGLNNGAWKHQREAYDVIRNHFTTYIYMIPGSGKSKVIVDLHNESTFKRSLIVCPKNVIPTWTKQFSLHGRKVFRLFELTKGSSAKKNEDVKRIDDAIFIVNYDSVWRIPELLKKRWDCIVFDEIHRLQSSTTQVSKFCRKLKGLYKVGLTGTCGEPKKWHGQFLSLDENLFGLSRKRFQDKYFILDYFGNPLKLRSGTDLKDSFAFYSHIATNEDVVDIPEAQHTVVDIPLKCKREYKSIEHEFMLEVENGTITVQNAMTKSLKLRQVCSGFILDAEKNVVELSKAKEDYLKEMLLDLENVVVFYNFKHECEQIKRAAKGRPFKVISGQKRDDIENIEPGTVLAVQIRAGGTGIDGLQKNFAHCIYYSLTWSEIDHEQSIRRLYRAGQKRNTFFYYMVTKGTVEEKVYKTLKDKKKVMQEVAGV